MCIWSVGMPGSPNVVMFIRENWLYVELSFQFALVLSSQIPSKVTGCIYSRRSLLLFSVIMIKLLPGKMH